MKPGTYERTFLVQPDHCDKRAGMSPLAVFSAFQAISAEHAELLGIGAAGMLRSRKFWVTVHNRIELTGMARLLDELTAVTWPVPCEPDSTRVFREYSLMKGTEEIARGKTQWAILNPDGTTLAFKDSGFPADFTFADRAGIKAEPVWFTDDFLNEEESGKCIVRSTDIDFGNHMNNIAYVRRMLDQFPADQIKASDLRAIEIHYGHPCRENELLTIYKRMQDHTCLMAIRKADGKTAAFGMLEFS